MIFNSPQVFLSFPLSFSHRLPHVLHSRTWDGPRPLPESNHSSVSPAAFGPFLCCELFLNTSPSRCISRIDFRIFQASLILLVLSCFPSFSYMLPALFCFSVPGPYEPAHGRSLPPLLYAAFLSFSTPLHFLFALKPIGPMLSRVSCTLQRFFLLDSCRIRPVSMQAAH